MQVQRFRGWLVLEVLEDLDMASAPALRQRALAQLSAGERMLAIDLTHADFLDSTGLGTLVAILKRVRLHDGELAVICPEPRLRRVFELTDLEGVLGVCAARADLAEVTRGPGT